MKIRIFIAAVIIAIALPAAAGFRTVQQAYEVELVTLRLPQSESGTLGFKACSDCEYMTKRLSADTQWILNGRSISLQKFRMRLARVKKRENRYVTVLHHLENDRITRVKFTII